MGSTASKPETKVFTPAAPVEYSASFLSHLGKTQESDYARAQYTEEYIQERVAEELRKLEAETIKGFQDKVHEISQKETTNETSVVSSNEKLESLIKALHENATKMKIEIPVNISEARNSVVSCLKENKGKVLNCWSEVEDFKKLVHAI